MLSFAIVMGCTSRTINPGFKIIGNIEGLKDGKVYLYKYVKDEWMPVDTVKSVQGSFMFMGRVEIPEMYRIEINDTLPNMAIFVENDEINLVGKVDSLSNYKVAGSKSHEEYESFWGSQKVYSVRMDSIENAWKAAKERKDDKTADKLDQKMDDIWNSQTESIRKHVLNNNKSVVSAYLAWSRLASNSSLEQLKEIKGKLDTSLGKSIYLGLLDNYIATIQKTEIGQPAIDFSMETPDGKVLQLSSLYGKYLLVDFWASWCSPCRAENPNVVKVFNKYKDKSFDILGVSFDKDKAKWLKAVKDDNLSWNHVSDLKGWGNAAGKEYGIRSIPSNILLDPKGVIIAKNLRGEDLEKKIKELIK